MSAAEEEAPEAAGGQAAGAEGLSWRPYASRGGRTRVRDQFMSGADEFELCSEGGAMMIRRTVYKRGQVSEVLEACRGALWRDVEAEWLTLCAARRRRPGNQLT